MCGAPEGAVFGKKRELNVIEPWVNIRQCYPPAHDRRFAMTSHSDEIVPHVPHEFQNLLGYMMGPDARAQTAYTVE